MWSNIQVIDGNTQIHLFQKLISLSISRYIDIDILLAPLPPSPTHLQGGSGLLEVEVAMEAIVVVSIWVV